jgi:hypothetical protein
MKNYFSVMLAAALLFITAHGAFAQGKDACSLISTVQVNSLIGCHMKDGKSVIAGKRCGRTSEDATSAVTLEYYDWHKSKTALDMLKMSFDESSKNIKSGKKAVGIYTSIKSFPGGGQNALIMTGEGSEFTNGNVVRIQFVIGSINYTFDTQGIERNKVTAKAIEIFNIIKTNAQ